MLSKRSSRVLILFCKCSQKSYKVSVSIGCLLIKVIQRSLGFSPKNQEAQYILLLSIRYIIGLKLNALLALLVYYYHSRTPFPRNFSRSLTLIVIVRRIAAERVLIKLIPPAPYSKVKLRGSYLSRSFSSSRHQISTLSLRRQFSSLKYYKRLANRVGALSKVLGIP